MIERRHGPRPDQVVQIEGLPARLQVARHGVQGRDADPPGDEDPPARSSVLTGADGDVVAWRCDVQPRARRQGMHGRRPTTPGRVELDRHTHPRSVVRPVDQGVVADKPAGQVELSRYALI